MPVGAPVATKKREGIVGKRHGAIFAAFAGAYMEKHRLCVDVVDSKSERFAEADTTESGYSPSIFLLNVEI